MRDNFLAAIFLIGLAGCLTNTQIETADLLTSIVMVDRSNVPINDISDARVTVHLGRADGQPIPNQRVALIAEHCTIQQPTHLTDANGDTFGMVRCDVPTQELIGYYLNSNGLLYKSSQTALVNFYAPVQGNSAVAPNTLLNFQVAVRDGTAWRVDYNQVVHISTTDTNASLPPDYQFNATDHGVHMWVKSVRLQTPGMQSITATELATGRVLGREDILVANTLAPNFRVTQQGTAYAGSPVNFELVALDSLGNVNPYYHGTVACRSPDPELTIQPYTFTAADAGVHTFTSAAITVAGAHELSCFDIYHVASADQEATIWITAAPAQSLILAVDPKIIAAQPFSVNVTAVDVYGNVDTHYMGEIQLISDDPNATLPPPYRLTAVDAGVAAFPRVVLNTAGLRTLSGQTPTTASIAAGTKQIIVEPGAVTGFEIVTDADIVAGQASSVTVAAIDSQANTVAGYQGTVQFSGDDSGGVYPGSYDFAISDFGIKTFTDALIIYQAGNRSVTVNDANAGIRSTQAFVVNPGPLKGPAIRMLDANVTAGVAVDIVLSGVDSYGNTVPSYMGTISMTSSDNQATLPPATTVHAADAGSVMLPAALTLRTAGTETVSVTDSSGALVSGQITVFVQPGPTVALGLGGVPSSVIINEPSSPVVTALDAFGNASAYRGTVHFSSSDAQARLPVDYAFAARDNGQVQFVNGVQFKTVGVQSLTVSDNGASLNATMSGINVQHGCYVYGNGALPVPNYAYLPKLALDSNDQPTLAVESWDGTEMYVYALRYTGVQWQGFGRSGDHSAGGVAGTTATLFGMKMGHNNAPAIISASWWPSPPSLYYWAWDGNAWISAGGAATPQNPVASPPISVASLALDTTGAPWIVTQQQSSPHDQLDLLHYTSPFWREVDPNGPFTDPNILNLAPVVAVDGNQTPYVAWYGNSAGTYQVYVQTWSSTGGWTGLQGSNSGLGVSQSSGSAVSADLALDGLGRPVVVWQDSSSGNNEIYLKAYDGSGWVELANSGHGGGISHTPNDSQQPHLVVDANGLPLVAWNERINGGTLYARRFDGTTWVEMNGSASGLGVQSPIDDLAVSVDSQGNAVFAWLNGGHSFVCTER